jgi:rhodanese-related sulfurtransferase
MSITTQLNRVPRREDPCMLPQPVGQGLFRVDGTWGKVQPMELAPGVRTIGELELIEHLEQGWATVDTRLKNFFLQATIPGAHNIPHEQILDRRHELDPETQTVFFCNGPQCTATPDAISTLLRAGHPPHAVLYYRGGLHDWMTLGYPTIPGAD